MEEKPGRHFHLHVSWKIVGASFARVLEIELDQSWGSWYSAIDESRTADREEL